jgi:acyl-coenzyme A thioesterase PaaI-like protein
MNTPTENKNPITHKLHGFCVACGAANPAGLRLKFLRQPDGSVSAAAFCVKELTGYDGLLHGGVAAMMLDSAMTNCLFGAGITALTGELNIKYKAPVKIGRAVGLKAWIEKDWAPLYLLKAELSQDGEAKVTADAKFMKTDVEPVRMPEGK